jgi:hypothetical protein
MEFAGALGGGVLGNEPPNDWVCMIYDVDWV